MAKTTSGGSPTLRAGRRAVSAAVVLLAAGTVAQPLLRGEALAQLRGTTVMTASPLRSSLPADPPSSASTGDAVSPRPGPGPRPDPGPRPGPSGPIRSTLPTHRSQPTSSPAVLRGVGDAGARRTAGAHGAAPTAKPGTVAKAARAALRGVDARTTGSVRSRTAPGGRLTDDLRGMARSALRALPGLVPADGFRGARDRQGIVVDAGERPILRHALRGHAPGTRPADARPAGEGTAAASIAQALRGSHSASARLQRSHADRARVHAALGAFLPQVRGVVEGVHGPQTRSLEGETVTRAETGVTAGIELSMPLFASGANLALYRQARATARSSDLSYLAEEQKVALDALAAHVNLRLNRRIEATLKRNVEAMQRIATAARRLFQAGDASRTDIALAQANVESARAELDLARKSREEVEIDFETLTGRPAPARLDLPVTRALMPATLADARAATLRLNPTIAAAHARADAQEQAARAETARFGPRVDLSGSVDHDIYDSAGTGGAGGADAQWNIGVTLRVPLFDATRSATVQAARHEAREQRHRALDESRELLRTLARTWSSWRSAERRIAIAERQVAAVSRSLEGARREYRAGYRSITDVLGDQVKLARARITLEEARHEAALRASDVILMVGRRDAIASLAGGGRR